MTAMLQKVQLALPSLLFGGNPVPESSTVKLLGVTSDPKLSFAEPISVVLFFKLWSRVQVLAL